MAKCFECQIQDPTAPWRVPRTVVQSFQSAMPAPVEEYLIASDGITVYWSIDPTPKNQEGSVHAIFYKLSLSIRKPESTTWDQESDYDVPIEEVTTVNAGNELQVDKDKVYQYLFKAEFEDESARHWQMDLFGPRPGR